MAQFNAIVVFNYTETSFTVISRGALFRFGNASKTSAAILQVPSRPSDPLAGLREGKEEGSKGAKGRKGREGSRKGREGENGWRRTEIK